MHATAQICDRSPVSLPGGRSFGEPNLAEESADGLRQRGTFENPDPSEIGDDYDSLRQTCRHSTCTSYCLRNDLAEESADVLRERGFENPDPSEIGDDDSSDHDLPPLERCDVDDARPLLIYDSSSEDDLSLVKQTTKTTDGGSSARGSMQSFLNSARMRDYGAQELAAQALRLPTDVSETNKRASHHVHGFDEIEWRTSNQERFVFYGHEIIK
jgi:hypothetical protein